jgi:hypothetical protein
MNFCTNTGTLFYFAFVKPNVNLFGVNQYCVVHLYDARIDPVKAQAADNCFGTVAYALFIAILTSFFVGNLIEVCWPMFSTLYNRKNNAVITPAVAPSPSHAADARAKFGKRGSNQLERDCLARSLLTKYHITSLV